MTRKGWVLACALIAASLLLWRTSHVAQASGIRAAPHVPWAAHEAAVPVAQEEFPRAQDAPVGPLLVGRILDQQGQPVPRVEVALHARGDDDLLAQARTQPDGRFILPAPDFPPGERFELALNRAHFEEMALPLEPGVVSALERGESVVVPTLTLARGVGAAFWLATAIFLGMLALIAVGNLHNTLVALLGAALVFAVSYLGEPLSEELFIFDFETAIEYVDWNVIFLVMGMMMVIAVIEETGLFQWLAFTAYRLSGGRGWLLLVVLMFVAGVASAFLDNVTTMLLMTPISVQIALAMGLNPLTLLVPEVMASNVIGVSTLVGTPTNILIGSFADISFNDFLINLTPGVLLSFSGLVVYSLFIYRRDLRTTAEVSPRLSERLAERAQISEPGHLRKAGWVGLGMLILFVFGEI
ncbi:MAG: SLC13 family permease, partial [Candidatus Promineifilaceae bacterium]|nr:SLC13 family permease [Candidatus Promineifilaceae bacterium]